MVGRSVGGCVVSCAGDLAYRGSQPLRVVFTADQAVEDESIQSGDHDRRR